MAMAPLDMLRKTREQFAKYAREHRAKASDIRQSAEYRESAKAKAIVNEDFVTEIDATLREWG